MFDNITSSVQIIDDDIVMMKWRTFEDKNGKKICFLSAKDEKEVIDDDIVTMKLRTFEDTNGKKYSYLAAC